MAQLSRGFLESDFVEVVVLCTAIEEGVAPVDNSDGVVSLVAAARWVADDQLLLSTTKVPV